MTFKNTLDKIIVGVSCIAALGAEPAIAEQNTSQPLKSKTEYTLELGATDSHSVRSRLWINNLAFNLRSLKLNYEGFNETEDGSPDAYYGWHRITVGDAKGPKGVIGFNTDKTGITQTLVGIRDTNLIEHLKGYGFLDILGGDEGLQLTVFYGRELDRNTAVELFHEVFGALSGEPEHYTELQMNHQNLFYRGEILDFNVDDARHILGYRFKF